MFSGLRGVNSRNGDRIPIVLTSLMNSKNSCFHNIADGIFLLNYLHPFHLGEGICGQAVKCHFDIRYASLTSSALTNRQGSLGRVKVYTALWPSQVAGSNKGLEK